MAQIREILYRTIQGDSGRKIGRSLGISRTSVRKYLDIASKQFGFTVNTPVAAIDQIALQVSDAIYQGKGAPSSYRFRPSMAEIDSHNGAGYWLPRLPSSPETPRPSG